MFRRLGSATVLAGGVAALQVALDRSEKRKNGTVLCDDVSKSNNSAMNSAFVFIKPHANTPASQTLVTKTLKEKGITITGEGELTAAQIDEKMLIDQHYYAIASKATLLKPAQMPIPKDKFKAEFGLDFDSALSQGIVYNAIDACKYLGLDASGLDAAWGPAKKVKFGGGFYCAELEPNIPGKAKKIYVL